MIMIYITLNTSKEAESLAKILLERELTNCVNFFPITCSYIWEGEITTEPETVLLVKTKEDLFDSIVRIAESHITYTNFIGQIPVDKVNVPFLTWFNQTVSGK
ncbi:MAG: divalent-cation tolerance protein CutA [Dehalococcoidia bacterium]|nr:divalent-cation tolerance protein CutA [Dehalococcoidia bacterium]